jgi:hypothetical protein
MKPNMKNHLSQIGAQAVLALVAASGLALLPGCAGPKQAREPVQSGFLTHYCQLEPVDDTTWRHINSTDLGHYEKFRIGDVKVLTDYYAGKPLSEETKQKGEGYVREAITKALSDRYSIVTTSGLDVADIRVAITAAYKTGNHLGLTVESEIVDSRSLVQLAAVLRTDVSDSYFSDYWDGPAGRQLVNEWASNLRKAIDASRGHKP